jgi:hypothetical protein
MAAKELFSLRERLSKLDDTTLRKFVRAAQFFASPAAHAGERPDDWFLTQYVEAKAEWERRYPAKRKKSTPANDPAE